MVAAHSFDITGARACGYRAAYVNRYNLPNEASPYQPDFEVDNFHQPCRADARLIGWADC